MLPAERPPPSEITPTFISLPLLTFRVALYALKLFDTADQSPGDEPLLVVHT